MKFIFIILGGLLLSSSTMAQTSTSTTTKIKTVTATTPATGSAPASTSSTASIATLATPEALSLTETEFDFGKIPQGKPVTHVFEFKNIGTTPLSLDNVQASCGCTTPEWNKDVVAPGATSKITVGYNAQNEGTFAKPVTVTYNGNQTKQIIIKGDVWKTPVSSAPENTKINSLKNEQ
ncbi:MAG: DUF1573 domain-containing protein [Bacteroidota bacterium]|nr:DUF1573 domain-containing protein [Bacteroidota bacterium]